MKRLAVTLIVAWLAAGAAPVASPQAASETARARLPQSHEYQRILRDHMATLAAEDFAHGVTGTMSGPPAPEDPDFRYRAHLLTLMHQPLVGSKRGVPAINAPPGLFTLDAIESSAEGVLLPPVWPEALMSVVQWNYAGNPYHDNRGLKLRCFVTAAVMLMMADDYTSRHPEVGPSGRVGYHLVYWASPYPGFKDLLPPRVREAYATGLRRMAERVMEWGPRRRDSAQDAMALVGLWYARQAVDDPAFQAAVAAHVGRSLDDPSICHPAGYFVDAGGFDAGIAGAANYFAVWLALMSGRDDARRAVERVYRLRAHLILPEPDGSLTAPTQFHTLAGMPAHLDQWAMGGTREHAAAMLTDEAAHLAPLPAPDILDGAAAKRGRAVQENIRENPVDPARSANGYVFFANDEIASGLWLHSHVHRHKDRAGLWRMFLTYNFPASVNPGYEFYPPGEHARRLKMERDSSPLLASPFARGETFVRAFDRAFVVVAQAGFRGILHTGAVGPERADEGVPAGFGGGQLAAFSTPTSGAVLVGRRSGKELDAPENWRRWPIHAVSGLTGAGKVFTSGRIVAPEVAADLTAGGGTVTVSGTIPAAQLGQGAVLEGTIAYRRTFRIMPAGVRVETTLTGDGRDRIAELYETLPVFLGERGKGGGAAGGPGPAPTAIEFLAAGKWVPADAERRGAVQAVRLTRFAGAVEVRFDAPQAVRLAPADWIDTHLSRAACRTVLIDRLGGGSPAAVAGEQTLAYTVAPVSQPEPPGPAEEPGGQP